MAIAIGNKIYESFEASIGYGIRCREVVEGCTYIRGVWVLDTEAERDSKLSELVTR